MNLDGVFTGSRKLSTMDSSGFTAGDSVYVLSVGAPYRLWGSPGPAGALASVPADNLDNYWWVREPAPNPRWWTPTAWNVNPLLGNDEDPTTLKTCSELYARLLRAQLPVPVTFNILGDVPDADSLILDFDSPRAVIHAVQGIETVVETQVVGSAVPINMATNQLNMVTVTGYDFAPKVGKAVRIGTTRYAVVLEAPSLGTAKLSPFYDTSNGNTFSAAAGDVLQFVSRTKGPLVVDVRGIHGVSTRAKFLAFGGTGFFASRSFDSTMLYQECEFAGSQGGIFYGTVSNAACVYRGGSSLGFDHHLCGTQSNLIAGSVFLDLPGQGITFMDAISNALTSCCFKGSSVTPAENGVVFLKGNNACVDLHAAQPFLNMTSNASTLVIHGAVYGDGNDPASIGVQFNLGVRVYYTGGVPTMNAGRNIVFPGGDKTWADLPLHLDPVSDACFMNGA